MAKKPRFRNAFRISEDLTKFILTQKNLNRGLILISGTSVKYFVFALRFSVQTDFETEQSEKRCEIKV